MADRWTQSRRTTLFALVCVASAGVIALYATVLRPAAEGAVSATTVMHSDPGVIQSIASEPHVLFRSTSLKGGYGQIAMLPLDGLDTARIFTSLECERVYYAAGQGICLSAERSMTTAYRMELFDDQYRVGHAVPLGGLPSRARVSRDGARAALTYFVTGDSYSAAGFSTRTFVIDVAKPDAMANLESFAVTRDGAPFKSVDFNFWGVTFKREPGLFYATLSSGGTKYLVEGDAVARTARVIRDGVECPSLSPDNRRIAFKHLERSGVAASWRIAVLDLTTGEEIVLPETRSVDDQVEWLDDETIIYAMPDTALASSTMNIWAVRADGTAAPRLLIPDAESPAVVRPGAE
jgi:hypothetical protein